MAFRKAKRAATASVHEPLEFDHLGRTIEFEATPSLPKIQAASTVNVASTQSGGRKSRDKGNRAERALVRFFQGQGFGAERVPLSGAAGGSYVGDVTIPLLGVDRTIEVKCRADGFRELYTWLDGRDLLVVKADRREPLVVVPLALAAQIARAAERAKAGGQ
jgi:Holliday junction resolvase